MGESALYQKALGCLVGGVIGDAMGEPTENKHYRDIEANLGWVNDFQGGGTDDTVLRDLLAKALIRTGGYATLDDWAQVWLDEWDAIFGPKTAKFFVSVLHTARKLRIQGEPRMAALGNVPCSSSAMCIAPVGIVNACNPRQAALQARNLASLINVHDAAFCQDGAAAIAAAVAAAFDPAATVDAILDASVRYLEVVSGRAMREAIARALDCARASGDYVAFRATIWADPDPYLQTAKINSLETVPITLALVWLADGEVETALTYAANFGRDADTMAAMAGAITGALRGIEGIRAEWVERACRCADVDQRELAADLAETARRKMSTERETQAVFDSIT